MVNVKLILACVPMLFLTGSMRSQSLVLVLTNEKNHTEYVIEPHDKILLDIKNKRGKLKEKEEVVVVSVDKENLYVVPDKKRFGEQAVHIKAIKHVWIKTPGTRAAGCLLFGLNLASKTSNAPTVYKKINLDKGKWNIRVEDKRR